MHLTGHGKGRYDRFWNVNIFPPIVNKIELSDIEKGSSFHDKLMKNEFQE